MLTMPRGPRRTETHTAGTLTAGTGSTATRTTARPATTRSPARRRIGRRRIGRRSDRRSGAGRPGSRASGVRTGGLPYSAIVVCLLLVLGLALFWLPLRGVRLDTMSGYGVISVLPALTLLGVAVLTANFLITLALSRPRPVLLTAQLLGMAVSLHALAQALEPVARFPTAWQHAGFIEYITRTHGVDTMLDARFNWPGFFALVGFATKAIGQDDLEPVLHWAPVVTNLLYLGPFALILRTLQASWRAKWFAAWLFPVANWVGQDYLSPQAFGYLLYLCWVAILLNWFRPPPATIRGQGRRRRSPGARRTGRFWRAYDWTFGPMEPGELPPRPIGVRERAVLFLLLVAVSVVATAAHQLTPFLMIATTAGLVLARRCTLRGLPLLGAVVFVAWLSFMTRAYWAGHLNEVLGGVGRLGTNLSASVGQRITDGSAELARVQFARVALAVLVSLLALLGLLRRRARRTDDRVALVLLLAPFASFGLQSYGGEIALRTYFFMLPGACILTSYLFFPARTVGPVGDPAPDSRTAPVVAAAARRRPRLRLRLRDTVPMFAAGALALVLVFGFVLVRFGNERFERVRPGEVKAFDAILERRPKGAIDVVWLTAEDTTASGFPVMPWSHHGYERFGYPVLQTSLDPAGDVEAITAQLREQGQTGFFVTTRGHEAYLDLSGGLPVSYSARLRAALSQSRDLQVVFADPDAAVFALRSPPPQPDPPLRPAARLSIGLTPWTPAGVVYLPVLLGLLIARELRRLRTAPGRRRLRPYTVLAVPLLAGLIAVVVERFMILH
ncbi:hypothetical protein [Actinomadura sp. HBU206391]|uniref:hypothetical protein n=1 Tax=Actinomadura sp. HBU206391 TaxID=2731692 RepID=UPI00164F3D3F|nr:hypothetical protein [Actinomadura sp. HBU206391]MBC6459318.1 hypothetical protein [Actinomadura sp. HBU206391]